MITRRTVRREKHRGRLALGDMVTSEYYSAIREDDGTIVLTPVQVVPVAKEKK